MLSAYGLTSPLLSHSSPTVKQEENVKKGFQIMILQISQIMVFLMCEWFW